MNKSQEQNLFFNLMEGLLSPPTVRNKEVTAEILRVNIKEDTNKYEVTADIPGIPKEDIKVNFDKGTLHIEVSERKEKELVEGEKTLRFERFFSAKQRSFYLSDMVDEANIEAEYKDGVLTLLLPKKESAKTVRQIEIK
jgi:HSP20 family protein